MNTVCVTPSSLESISAGMASYMAATYGSSAEAQHMDAFSRSVSTMDGYFFQVCRPTDDQRLYYNGYEHRHGVKVIVLVMFDGLLAICPPQVHGSAHDSGVANFLGLYGAIEDQMSGYFVLVDSAFAGSPTILKKLTDLQAALREDSGHCQYARRSRAGQCHEIGTSQNRVTMWHLPHQ